ncbi:hypothetical protein VNI00_006638 [Paramarasmius palmivorus]|uniref:Uncharacterized protein n=1 Tax=Paramarasmius palmivorus TaxID=297713 RepID=A0AAW0DAX7_9AGAR
MEDRPAQIIPLACRFIPYDQWLITHIDTCWKISQLKAWFIAKCIISPPSSSSAQVPSFLTAELPPKPSSKPPKRPASPIVFAPEPPKGRSISPIRFAPLDSVSVAGTGTSVSYEGGSSEDEGTTIAMGYEEDDELDSDEPGIGLGGGSGRFASRSQYLSHFERRPATRSVAIEHHRKESASASTPSADSVLHIYHPRRLMLIRFSTGQVLEDHFRVEDVNISPYELIEIQRCDVVLQLPRTIPREYVKPYWEGWAKALRVVSRDPGNSSASRKKRKDANQPQSNTKRRPKLDWKERWVFVKDGTLNLLKDRKDPTTAQELPLDTLIEIRGSEQLGRTVVTSSSHIICAKFRSTQRHRPPPLHQPELSTLYQPILMAPYEGPPQTHLAAAIPRHPLGRLSHETNLQLRRHPISKPKPPNRLIKEHRPESDGGDSDDERETQPQVPQPNSDNEDVESQVHKHPFSSSQLPPDPDDSSSGSLSSPVFAHSDVDSSDEGPRPIYRYDGGSIGLRRRKEMEKDRPGVRFDSVEPEPQPEADKSFVLVSKETEKPVKEDKTSGNEWIVLDLGDDHAFRSFIRILHRHAPHIVTSTFLSSFPAFSSTASTPPPDDQNEGHTPDPSPIVFAPAPHQHHQGPEEGSQAFPLMVSSSRKGREWKSEPSSPIGTYRFPPNTPHTPPRKLGLEALPYPEWRIEVVERARKLGLGGMMRGMEFHLWGPAVEATFQSGFLFTRSKEAKEKKNQETKGKGKEKQREPSGSDSGDESFYSAGEDNPCLDTSEGDTDSEGYLSSDAEWVSWTADLPRQRDNLVNATKVAVEEDLREPEEHALTMEEERLAREPIGHVIGPSPAVSPVVESFAYATGPATASWGPAPGQPLNSPSSNESLRGFRPRKLSFGRGPGEPSSPHREREAMLTTTGMHHFSGYEGGRRPSLPLMSAFAGPGPASPSTLPIMEHQVRRRGSLASTGGGRLRKKDKDDKDKDKKGKAREREPETDHDHSTDTHSQSQRRPALSVSTATARQPPYHQPPTSPKFLRRVRSWEEAEEEVTVSASNVRNNPPVKKKGSRGKGLVREVSMRAEKLVQGLESALDFVDGRQ